MHEEDRPRIVQLLNDVIQGKQEGYEGADLRCRCLLQSLRGGIAIGKCLDRWLHFILAARTFLLDCPLMFVCRCGHDSMGLLAERRRFAHPASHARFRQISHSQINKA
jgi:hypothetical protein